VWILPHPLLLIQMLVKTKTSTYSINTTIDLLNFIKLHNLISDLKSFNTDIDKILEARISNNTIVGLKKLRREILSGIWVYKSKWVAEYWISRGYDETTTKQIISDIQSKNANKFVNSRRQNPTKYNESYSNRVEYWLKKGYSMQEANLHLKNRQTTFSLEKCIERYGEIDGNIIFNKRQDKWISSMKSKPQTEIDSINRKKTVSMCRASLESIKVFQKTLNLLNEHGLEYYIGVGDKNEYFLLNKLTNNLFWYDLTIPDLRIIVEYNGCKWHPKSESDVWDNPFKLDKSQLLNKDKLKIQTAIDYGFDVLILWSDSLVDINSDKCYEYVLNKLKKDLDIKK